MMNFPPMPLLPISSATTINACKSLPLRPTDVFICSYPKSGTTWTQHIVLTLLLASRRCHPSPDDDEILSGYNHVSEYAPFFEIDAHWDHDRHCLIESIQRNHDALHQRVFNTHLRWEMLPKQMSNEEDNNDHLRPACGKFIYVTRNLPDVCASFYHHLSNQKEGTYHDSFSKFSLDWMEGTLPFGSPLHHLLSFAEGFSDNSYADVNVDHENNKCALP